MPPLEEEIAHFRRTRATSPVPRGLLVKRVLWSMVQATVYRYSFHTSNRWRGFLLRIFGAKVGDGCTIRRTSLVYYPWNLSMGPMSCLGDRCEVYNLGRVEIGKRVLISQHAYLCAGTHDYRVVSMPLLTPPIVVKDDSWVCAKAFVGPGVTVGEGAIVAAAAVAVRDVEDWTIVGGNPAKVIKRRAKLEE